MSILKTAVKRLGALLCLAAAHPAFAAAESPRMALIVGNSAYTSIGALPNPTADARLMASTLDELGFDTYLALDSDQSEMKRQIADFGRRLRASSKDTVGFFYYAGHGVQADGRNYLLPVEATPTDKADLDLMGVEANWVLRQMESAGNRTNIIVLDACRNNPFVASSRSLSRGLAQIDAPTGSFISYATAPGKVALDGDSVNSPFTTALAKALPTPGLPIEQIFKRVRVDVIEATNGKQIPWDSSSLVEDLVMQPDASSTALTAAATTPAQSEAELELWESVSASGDADRISLFLQIYPDSPLATEARTLLMETIMTPSKEPEVIVTAELPSNTVVEPVQIPEPVVQPDPEPVQENVMSDAERQLKELELITQAQSSKSAADYQAYLDTFPDGVFVDLASAEIANIEAAKATSATAAPEAPAVVEEAPVVETVVASRSTDNASLTINAPLSESIAHVGEARSIKELSQGSPLFPPFEGLDPSYWQNEVCSNCHAWDQASLCKQGTFYTTADPEAVARIQHPYGGFFKSALRVWAAAECR